ncbi:Imm32 family immunity protein [Paenibacillus anseongense]|uniref:Imm32 family immunity protein n=1 Tax=Paenibacillus anseongense TaxID=2682845 RepID=UPI002DBEAAC7|nr:hypothetical protein [Paenibacillus anseongense]MEC0270444.1 hypothetical protein [Paenibacillus anseongense]
MDSVVVNLNINEDIPKFTNKDNVGQVEILSNNRVMITLSKNGLIGFAQELLRMAHNDFTDGYHIHVDPSEKGYVSQTRPLKKVHLVEKGTDLQIKLKRLYLFCRIINSS